jgi:general secretion pathway protein B
MSTILDALKKSERERTVLRGLGFSDAGWRPARDVDWLRWVVIGGIVALVVVATVIVVLRAGIVSVKSPAVAVAPEPKTAEAAAPAAPADSQALPATALVDVAVVPPPKAPVLVKSGKAEFLISMSPEFQKTVPPMTVNIHVYASDESRRILYINNRQYRGGDEIPGGVRVEEIIPEGVVLQFQGQRFKLARPS